MFAFENLEKANTTSKWSLQQNNQKPTRAGFKYVCEKTACYSFEKESESLKIWRNALFKFFLNISIGQDRRF
jgi:hypothetical protein